MSRKRETSAGEYYVSARQFLRTFDLITTNPRFRDTYHGAVLAASENAAFCAECFLKELLIKNGVKQRLLMTSEIGHDIVALRDMCVEKGLDFGPLLVNHVLEDLSPLHNDFRFRYFEEKHQYTIRGHVEILQALERLDDFVRERVSDEL